MRTPLKWLLSRTTPLGRLGAASRPRVVVLMYHDLRDDDDFPNWLRVPVSEFAAQLRLLRGIGEFITPEQSEHPERLDPARLHFLLTFDDGYANNHRLAMPVLTRLRVPALFCVSTGPLEEGRCFWPDIVITPIQVLGLEQLDLTAAGLGLFRFRRGNAAARWDDIERLLVTLKAIGDEDHPTVAAVLADIRAGFPAALAQHLPRFAPLTTGQIREMAANPWCHFGSHSHDHRLLTRLDEAGLARNLTESRRILEACSQAPIRHLAYPNGDADSRVAAAAAAAGYGRAYTVSPGILTAATDPFAIPRLGVAGCGPRWLLRYQLARLLLGERLSTRNFRDRSPAARTGKAPDHDNR